MCPLDYMCKVTTSENINHTIEYDTCDWVRFSSFGYRRTCIFERHKNMFFVKTWEQKNMFFLRQENMRTRGRVKACLRETRTWGLVGLCPTLVACVSSLNNWILHSSFFTFPLLSWQLTLSSATISHEICQHSAHFLPTFVRIHEFGSAYVCAKDRKKHRNEWLMHVFWHLREQNLHAFGAFSQAWHSWRCGFTKFVFNICHVC